MAFDPRDRMNAGFCDLQGGLFGEVSKADVGDVVERLTREGVAMLSWADPFKPDRVVPEHVKRAAIAAIEGGAEHYTAPIGSSVLKEKIAKKLRLYNKLDVDAQRNILITPGSDAGLIFAMMPFIEPGDEVLVPDPSYPSNFLNPRLLGGKTVPVPLGGEDELDIAAMEARVTPRTKMVVLTHPNNPTTVVYDREELLALADFVIRHDLILVCDQAFEDMVYDGREFVTPASLPGMFERTLTVCSISKGMALSGYRVGYVVASDKVMDVMYGSAVNVIGATSTASQAAAIAAFEDPSFMEDYKAIFDRRRKAVYDMFNSVPGVKMRMPQSAFLSWVDVSALGTSEEIVDYLVKDAKVSVNDGNAYGSRGRGHLRVIHGCYWDDQTLYAALERMQKSLQKLA